MQVGLPLTIADLALMPDDGSRYELLEGGLVVSRAQSLSHQRISGNIFALVHTYLQDNPIGEIFATPGIVFDEFDSVIPDLVVVSHERRDAIVADDRFIAAPELVIEIVSPGEGNARRDRVTKCQIYSRFGVSEYWVVDPAQQSVEVYELDADILELRATVTGQNLLHSTVLPAFACPAGDFFRRYMIQVIIAPYDPAWPVRFRELATGLRTALGSTALRIDHIGSTAIPGLAAKSIVDIQIAVVSFEPFDAIRLPLEALGYIYRADNSDLTKRYFREQPGTTRTHIHVRKLGSWSEQYALLFRDYVRAHPAVAAEYANVKHRLAEHYGSDRHGYTDAKGPFIWATMASASDWSQDVGWETGPSDA